ncbi:MAG: histidine phosphatase family protein, partial [Halioglobus sp.]|nr:histidine phosphatase family protein [Halioglobus sp.]
LLGHYLRDSGITLDAAISGNLLRQRQTAQLAMASQPREVPHHIDPRFNEINNDEQLKYLLPKVTARDPGVSKLVERGLSSSKDYQKVIDAVFNYWVSAQCDESRIQSWADYSGGVRAALQELMATQGSGRTLGVFTSGGTIATLVAQVLGLSGEQTYQFYEPVFNCSVTQIFYSGSKTSLSYFNDRSWLQLLGARTAENLVTYR